MPKDSNPSTRQDNKTVNRQHTPAATTQRNNSTTVTAKKSSIASLGVSISALTQKKEDVKTSISEKIEVQTESFTPIELINQWKNYTANLQEEHHLKNTMLNCLPELLSKNKFEVVVNNPVQEQRLLENVPNIIRYLRKNLRNTQIEMEVRVTVDNEKKLGFTSFEKYNLMVEQNEALKRLKDEFGLELL